MEWNWNNMQNQNAQAAADAGQRAALENELKQNEMRIAELKEQLQQNRTSTDDLDRKLAANRAGIGDTGTALAHQRAIDDRAQRAAMNAYAEQTRENEKASLAEANKKRLVGEIEDLDVQLSFADAKTKPALLVKRNRILNELRSLGGDYSEYSEQETPEELEMFKIQNTDKNGNWLTPEAKAYYDAQEQNTAAAAQNVKGSAKTAEQVAREREAAKKKANAAIDEVVKNVSEYELNKNGGKIAKKASNGKDVTIERTADGTILAKCGYVTRSL